MNTVNEVTPAALELDRAAVARYRELEEWFADRSLVNLASLCARLGTWHRDACARLEARAERPIPRATLRSTAEQWVRTKSGPRPREFLFRVASPRELLEMALAAEANEQCAALLATAIEGLGPVDWEADIESGAGPSLALGAERRLRAGSRA